MLYAERCAGAVDHLQYVSQSVERSHQSICRSSTADGRPVSQSVGQPSTATSPSVDQRTVIHIPSSIYHPVTIMDNLKSATQRSRHVPQPKTCVHDSNDAGEGQGRRQREGEGYPICGFIFFALSFPSLFLSLSLSLSLFFFSAGAPLAAPIFLFLFLHDLYNLVFLVSTCVFDSVPVFYLSCFLLFV